LLYAAKHDRNSGERSLLTTGRENAKRSRIQRDKNQLRQKQPTDLRKRWTDTAAVISDYK